MLFFKRIFSGRQIRRIDNGHGLAPGIQTGQQGAQQVRINGPQFDQVEPVPKLMQDFCIWNRPLVGQKSEVPPRAVFREQFDQQVKRVGWGQQVEQEHAK